MGFNIGGAITGALGGFLTGAGPVGAIIGGAAGGFLAGGGEKAKTTFAKLPQTKQAQTARAELFELATGKLPEVPRREIAPAQPLGKERRLARETALELAEPQDFFSLPEVQGIVMEATQRGDLLTNRVARMLQASGNITSTTGRDVLGRAVTDVQKSIAASLAPFAMEERARRERLIPMLETLGITEAEMARITTQAELDALFQQKLGELSLQTGYKPGLLKSIIGLQPGLQPQITGGGATDPLGGFGQLIGPLLSGALKGGGSGGGGQTITPPILV